MLNDAAAELKRDRGAKIASQPSSCVHVCAYVRGVCRNVVELIWLFTLLF